MALTFDSVAEALCDANGGANITCVGSFEIGRAYTVNAADNQKVTPCYSGISGQAALCYSQNGKTLTARLPVVQPGPLTITVRDTETGDMATLSTVTRAETAFLDAQTFALRQNVRPILATGPTDPGQLPDAEPVPGFEP